MSLMMSVISSRQLGLTNTLNFFKNYCFVCGSNHMYCELVESILQSVFRHVLGCGSNRLCLENYLVSEVSRHLHSCIIMGVLSYILIFYFIIWLLEVSLKYLQSSLTNFSAPEAFSRVFRAFILSPGVLVLILSGVVCKIVCEIDLALWY